MQSGGADVLQSLYENQAPWILHSFLVPSTHPVSGVGKMRQLLYVAPPVPEVVELEPPVLELLLAPPVPEPPLGRLTPPVAGPMLLVDVVPPDASVAPPRPVLRGASCMGSTDVLSHPASKHPKEASILSEFVTGACRLGSLGE